MTKSKSTTSPKAKRKTAAESKRLQTLADAYSAIEKDKWRAAAATASAMHEAAAVAEAYAAQHLADAEKWRRRLAALQVVATYHRLHPKRKK